MSKKLIAALGMSPALVACNTTADVTVDDESMMNDDVIMEAASSSSDGTESGAMIDAETGAEVEITD